MRGGVAMTRIEQIILHGKAGTKMQLDVGNRVLMLEADSPEELGEPIRLLLPPLPLLLLRLLLPPPPPPPPPLLLLLRLPLPLLLLPLPLPLPLPPPPLLLLLLLLLLPLLLRRRSCCSSCSCYCSCFSCGQLLSLLLLTSSLESSLLITGCGFDCFLLIQNTHR
jgi:hypothetical protein